MKFRLTNKQMRAMAKKEEAKTEKLHESIREGKLTFFSMDDEQCRRHFGLQNDTFHKPLCHTDKLVDGKVYVEATFLGSGVMSHPVRRGWIPLSEVKADTFSWSKVFFMSLLNIFKSDEFWERQDQGYMY